MITEFLIGQEYILIDKHLVYGIKIGETVKCVEVSRNVAKIINKNHISGYVLRYQLDYISKSNRPNKQLTTHDFWLLGHIFENRNTDGWARIGKSTFNYFTKSKNINSALVIIDIKVNDRYMKLTKLGEAAIQLHLNGFI